MICRRTLLLFCCICLMLAAAAQSSSVREKIFMHFDKNEYVLGDTIWFKTYVVDALTQKPAARSGIYYVELINQEKDFVRRFNYHVVLGTSFGQIPTDTSFFEPGIYKVRAYTNWMQNFGDSLFYEKEIVINDISIYNKWFLSMTRPVFKEDSVGVRLSFTDETNRPKGSQLITFLLQEGKRKNLIKSNLQLDEKGSVDIQFKLPEEKRQRQLFLSVSAPNIKGQLLKIPVNFKKPDIDLQFMPEGGHLVAGLKNKVGFKAIDQNGIGTGFEAVVKDNAGTEVATIQPLYKGMGYFEFTPQAGKLYTAIINNSAKEYRLPKVETSGVLLKVKKEQGTDKVQIILNENNVANNQYRMVINTRGYEVYATDVQLKNGSAILMIPQNAFPSGVATFLLSDLKGALISQRQMFIDNGDSLNIQIIPSEDKYGKRDSVGLTVKVKDKEGRPVIGSFSLAVTDDAQVTKDEEKDENILSYLLLQSDLKGAIETPAYYFKNTDGATESLDALMLTQGFVKYNWDSTKFTFKAEPEYTVSGHVVNYFNKKKGMANYGVSLYTYHGATFRLKTMADKNGYFIFKNIPQFDTAKFYISAKADTIEYKFGDKIPTKRFKAYIEMNQFKPALINTVTFDRYYNSKFNVDTNVFRTIAKRNIKFVSDDPTMLEEVIVKSNIIRGSKNLNGIGNADQIITEEEVKNADSNMDIFDFLKKHVKGYEKPTAYIPPEWNAGLENVIDQNYYGSIRGSGSKARLFIVIDGQFVDDPFLRILRSFRLLKPQDIKGLELITSIKYARKYNIVIRNYFDDETITFDGYRKYLPGFKEYQYLEITTQSGGGLSLIAESRDPGISEVQTPVFHYGKSSYVPKYTIKNKNDPKPDNRSTIYWEPTVVTNENGEATVSFYAADNPGTYNVSLQGVGLQGDIGAKTIKIKIVQ